MAYEGKPKHVAVIIFYISLYIYIYIYIVK